jgi:hypothetical protein
MNTRRRTALSIRTILLLGPALGAPRLAAAQSRFALHLFGVSYHYQFRTYRDASGVVRRYEQFNPGLGAEYLLHDGKRVVITADGGAYRDSKDRTNIFGGPALRLRVGSHLLVGGGIVALTSRTYATPVAPLPIVTARWSHLGVNGTWIPSLDRRSSGAVALFSTIYF